MKRRWLMVACATSMSLLGVSSLRAQETSKGQYQKTLKGELTFQGVSDQVTFDVTVDSSSAGERVSEIVMTYGGATFPFADIRMSESRLSFSFIPGNQPLMCALEKQDGDRYEGDCNDDGTANIRLRIDSLILLDGVPNGAAEHSLQRGGAPIH